MKKYSPFVLYLDYDGVLHSDDAYMDLHRRVYLRGGGVLFEYANRLEKILEPYPKVEIVLSTSWVNVKGFGRSKKRLPKSLQNRVIGSTWHSYFKHDGDLAAWYEAATRWEQIERDLKIRQPQNWLALDDRPEGWDPHFQSNLVVCDSDFGLSSVSTQDLLKIKLKKMNDLVLSISPLSPFKK